MSDREPPFGFDLRVALRDTCGIGRYSAELARALLALPDAPPLLLYGASMHGAREAWRLPDGIAGHPRARLFAPKLPAKLVAALARVPGFRTELFTGPLALFHHTSTLYLDGFRCPQVVTVHDLAFEQSREFHDPGFHERVRERMQAAIARASSVLVPSAATRADLVARWRVDEKKIAIVPLGGDHVLRVPRGERRDPRPAGAARARPCFVHVGTLEPRKNLPRLVRAHRDAVRRGLELDLVLVGAWGWRNDELRAELARSESERGEGRAGVFVRGPVDEPELRAWIEDAHALLYPSLCEGFGLPVVEAFHLGVPVVTSARSATLEVAGDAALLIDPESERGIADALLSLAGDDARRRELAGRGRARGQRFTWESCARGTLAAWRAATTGTLPRRS